MTKNNLAVHLKWLLKHGPSLYPSLTPSEPANPVVDVARDTASDQPSQLFDVSGPGIAELPTDARIVLENTVGNDPVTGDADMGRLLLAPPSASKPRMLSLVNNGSRTPKPSNKEILDGSLTGVQRSPQRKAVQGPQRDIPSSSRKSKPPHDVHTIDLTGDVDHTTSSGTVEEYGEPRRLWAEEAASPKEPEALRGKKRKSDEFMSGLLSPTRPPRKLQYSDKHGSPTLPAAKNHRSSPPANLSKRESPDPGRKHVQHVIADSDGEDEESLFDWIPDEEPAGDLGLDAKEPLYPVLPKSSPEEKNKGNLSQSAAHTSPPISLKNSIPITPSIRTGRPQIDKPDAHQSGSHQSSPFPGLSNSPDKIDQSVVQFLSLSAESLQQLTSSLKDTLRKNSEIVYQQAMEGHPALDVIAENKTLIGRIEAIEALQQQSATYEARVSERDGLKEALMQVISRGGDPLSMPGELARSRAIAVEQEQIEAKIRDLLPRADVLTWTPSSSDVKDPSYPSSAPLRSPAGRRSKVVDSPKVNNVFRNTETNGSPMSLSPERETSRKDARRADTSVPTTKPFSTAAKDSGLGLFDYDEPMLSDGEDCFTRTMGSPQLPAEGLDEFDLDADDEEMLEAAEHFEGGNAIQGSSPEPQIRQVFAETSGNVLRAPLSKKQSTQNPLWHNHPWSRDVKTALKERFHLRGFRPNQLEAIDATLSGKDTFVLMPTGGGKSLCYQLPSVVASGSTKGVTVVISPLLSLMQDQVSQLQRLNIKASLLNGETSMAERKEIMSILHRAAADEYIQLLYITPEMINKNQVLVRCLEKLNLNGKLARIVIDEAHCVSQWGHDFRPDYKELGEVRAQLPGVPMMALTATATENVKVDVIHNLRMAGCQIFSQSFNRPNLTYEVKPKMKGRELLDDIVGTIKDSYPNQSGIIYCLARKSCEKLASDLRDKHNLKAAHYHAGMKPDQKAKVQRDWQSGKQQVIVATIAFGMGIDKPDVRFVIHHSIPKSLEGYYQETGRAGRDGKRSGCYLYYGYRDIATLKRMIDKGEGSAEQKDRQRQMLRNVIQYCDNRSDCRRVQILGYFNEYFRREECNAACDNCKSGTNFEVRDYSDYAAVAVKIVRHFQRELKEDVTLLYCVDILLGSTKKLKSPSHKHVPGFGHGSALKLGEAERLFYRLLGDEALYEQNTFVNRRKFAVQHIKLGRNAAEFESGRRSMKLDVRVSPGGKKQAARSTRGPRGGNDHPQSTNVSSPIQSANNRRRLSRYRYDDIMDDDSDDDKDSDGFEPIRNVGKPRRERANKLGPPIANDPTWENLEFLHRTVAEDFFYYAKEYCANLMMEKSLRNQPFPDSVLREIAIHFPKDKARLSAIRGIDPDKVERYGLQILKLVRDAQRRYEELKKDKDDANGVVPDPNHHNVINLSSSDEFGDDPFDDGASAMDLDDNPVPSRFFTSRPTPAYESSDEYDPGPSVTRGSATRKRQPSKRPRRKSAGEPRSRAKTSKAKTKSSERAGNSSSARKGSTAKPSTSRIEMMPI